MAQKLIDDSKVGTHEHEHDEVDVCGCAERGEETPAARAYRVRIDCETVVLRTQHPTGEMLLRLVGKRPCAFELIEESAHCENDIVAPAETVDLRKNGLRGFFTAHREVVTITINDRPYLLQKGPRTVAEILAVVGQNPEAYMLLEEKSGPPLPLPQDVPVMIVGCEVFHSQVHSGASS